MIKDDVPAILSLGVSEKEQKGICIGHDTGVSGIKNEATKHDDAEVPTYLWNDRLTCPWRILDDPDVTINVERNKRSIDAADINRNKLMLPWWKLYVLSSFMVWFKATCRTTVILTPPKLAVWAKYWSNFNDGYSWKYFWTAVHKWRYLN
jgi:hypothetical protein